MTRVPLRVDTVPWVFRPVFLAVSFLAATAALSCAVLLRATCRIEYVGGTFDPAAPVVFCCWHDSFIPLVCGRAGTRFKHHVWMNHPAFFMKPVHFMLRFLGIKEVVLGSSGNGGRQAAERLVETLRSGASTLVYVDGPAGPVHVLKRGALHLAQQAGVPLVAVRVTTTNAWVFTRTWDSKRLPKPFSTIRFEFSAPLTIAADAPNLEALVSQL